MARRTGLVRWGLVSGALVVALMLAGAAVTLAQGGPPEGGPGAGRGLRVDSYSFQLEVDGVVFGGFVGLSGMSLETEVIESHEIGPDGGEIVRKAPGRTTYGDITLKRGLTEVDELSEWLRNTAEGAVDRRNGSIIIYDAAGSEVARYHFVNGWPSKWEGPELSAAGAGVVVETITITVEGIEREEVEP